MGMLLRKIWGEALLLIFIEMGVEMNSNKNLHLYNMGVCELTCAISTAEFELYDERDVKETRAALNSADVEFNKLTCSNMPYHFQSFSQVQSFQNRMDAAELDLVKIEKEIRL